MTYAGAMVEPVPDRPRKGRGAISNRSGRFEPTARVAVDDGWASGVETATASAPPGAAVAAEAPPPPPAPRTTVALDSSRTVIARNHSPDVPFDRSINPYRGCEHGCIYCFARPTHAYLGLSPGLDFETRLLAKPHAAELLETELARPAYRPSVIALGTNTDPYQPVERRMKITRQVLEVLARARHPVAIVTKSDLITRDLDILAPMAAAGLARVMVSVTTLEPTLARRMEPRAPRPARRLAAIRALSGAGVPTGVLAAPMIPGLNDDGLDEVLAACARSGATSAGYLLLRLPLEIKELFEEWLRAHYPNRTGRVLSLMRQTRGGKLYESAWGTRMRGRGPVADLLSRRFAIACRRHDLNTREWAFDTTQFRRPRGPGAQADLFD